MDRDRDSLPPSPPPPPAGPPPVVSLWARWRSRRILLVTVGLMLLGTLVQLAVIAATGRLFLAVGTGGLAMLLLLRAVVRGSGDTCRSFCAWRPLRPTALAGVLLTAAGCWYPVVALASWSAYLHPPPQEFLELLRRQIPRSPAGVLVATLAVVFLAPLAEETVFRALLYRLCRRWWPTAAGAVLTGLLFGLMHGEPWFLFGLVALGILLALVFELTGTLAAPWLLHAAHNAVSWSMMVSQPAILDAGTRTGPISWPVLAGSLAVLAVGLYLLARAGPAGPTVPDPVAPSPVTRDDTTV